MLDNAHTPELDRFLDADMPLLDVAVNIEWHEAVECQHALFQSESAAAGCMSCLCIRIQVEVLWILVLVRQITHGHVHHAFVPQNLIQDCLHWPACRGFLLYQCFNQQRLPAITALQRIFSWHFVVLGAVHRAECGC